MVCICRTEITWHCYSLMQRIQYQKTAALTSTWLVIGFSIYLKALNLHWTPCIQTTWQMYLHMFRPRTWTWPRERIGRGKLLPRCVLHMSLCCLSDVCLSRTSGLSREQRVLRIFNPCHTWLVHTTFKFKRSKLKVTRPLYSPQP